MSLQREAAEQQRREENEEEKEEKKEEEKEAEKEEEKEEETADDGSHNLKTRNPYNDVGKNVSMVLCGWCGVDGVVLMVLC